MVEMNILPHAKVLRAASVGRGCVGVRGCVLRPRNEELEKENGEVQHARFLQR